MICFFEITFKFNCKNNIFLIFHYQKELFNNFYNWGLGIGDWGLGVWGVGPNPQNPTPNPTTPTPKKKKKK